MPVTNSTVVGDSPVKEPPTKKSHIEQQPDLVAPGYPGPLRCKLLSEHAVAPIRGSDLAAGYDLTAAEDKIAPAHGKCLIKTNIAVAIASGYYGRVAPRSSLAWKNHIDVGAGVIDSDYRGDVGVV